MGRMGLMKGDRAEDKIFDHFIVGSMLLLTITLLGLVGLLLISLWEQGVMVFVVVNTVLWGFGWTVHKLATSSIVKDWLDSL